MSNLLNKNADDFFNSVDFPSIIDTIKGVYSSDGVMNTLLDFERVLDEADLYAYKNWELGELVRGPDNKKYSTACVFMYPEKLMPDPRGGKRLIRLGCTIKFKKTKIEVPVKSNTAPGQGGNPESADYTAEKGYLTGATGNSAEVYESIMIGDNAFGHAISLPVELRDGGVLDFGREHALAWYAIWGLGVITDQAIVKVYTN